MGDDWKSLEDQFGSGSMSLLEAILISRRCGPTLADVPEAPTLNLWLKGATVKCCECGMEVQPVTDLWGQILTGSTWVHCEEDRKKIDCPRWDAWLHSDLLDGDVEVSEDVDSQPMEEEVEYCGWDCPFRTSHPKLGADGFDDTCDHPYAKEVDVEAPFEGKFPSNCPLRKGPITIRKAG